MNRQRFMMASALLTSISFLGCAGTTVKSVWKDPAWTAPPMGSIMVVAAAEKIAIRRVIEDEVAKQLQAHGVMASASYPYGHPANPQALQEKVQQANFEGVLVLQMVDVKTITTTTPEETRINTGTGDPYGYNRPGYAGGGYRGGSGWGDYYNQSVTVTHTASQTIETKLISQESKLFAAKGNGQVIWTALTETYVPTEGGGQAKPFAQALVKSLVQSRVIPLK